MALSPAAKRLVSFVRGIPADRKEEIGKAFDAKHKKVMAKHENEYLAQAAAELSQVNFKERKDEKKKKKKKKKLKEELTVIVDTFINENIFSARGYLKDTKELLPYIKDKNRFFTDEEKRLNTDLVRVARAEDPNVVGEISAETGLVDSVKAKQAILQGLKKRHLAGKL